MSHIELKNLRPNNWMTLTSSIDSLTFSKLILSGAHNFGTDNNAAYTTSGFAHRVACENNTVLEQLRNGTRSLDVGVEYDVDARGVGTFRFQHNGCRSAHPLENLIMQLIRFLEENPDEFVLVDFHPSKSTPAFDHKGFTRFLLTHLGPRIIPTSNKHLSIGQLKKESRFQRVWLAAPSHAALDRAWFFPHIEHQCNEN